MKPMLEVTGHFFGEDPQSNHKILVNLDFVSAIGARETLGVVFYLERGDSILAKESYEDVLKAIKRFNFNDSFA